MNQVKYILIMSCVFIITLLISISIDYFILKKEDSLIKTIISLKKPKYLLINLGAGLTEVLLFYLLNLSNTFFMYYLVVLVLYKISEVDFKMKHIDLSLIILLAICSLLTQLWNKDVNIMNSIVTCLVTFIILGATSKITHEALGMGDAEVLALLGFVLGYEGLIALMLLASLIVCIYGIGVLIKCKKNKEIPFVPFIFISLIVLLVFNNIAI